MFVYTVNLVLILGLAYPLCIRSPSNRKKAVYLLVTLGYMWFLATFRIDIGFDYHSYITIFAHHASTGTLSEALALHYESGFSLLTWILTRFTHSSTAMYGVYTAVVLIPVGYFIYRYCNTPWLSIWLFVTLSFFYTAMNLVRQSMACSIVLLGYGFLRERKILPFLLIVLAGASFHKSALVMIPLYFLSLIPLNKATALVYCPVILTAYLASPWLLDIATRYVYTSYQGTIYVDSAFGFSPVFLLVPMSILAICLILGPVWRRRDPHAGLLTSMMLFSGVIWLFITNHFILERFSHYPYLLAMVAVPSALDSLKASPEELARLAALAQDGTHLHRHSRGELQQLRQKIRDHNKYYWAAVTGLVLLTWLYHEFGRYVSGFHNVFPYQSKLW